MCTSSAPVLAPIGAFALMLMIGCVFEAGWQITRDTNATTDPCHRGLLGAS
jgi:hypothetical protein